MIGAPPNVVVKDNPGARFDVHQRCQKAGHAEAAIDQDHIGQGVGAPDAFDIVDEVAALSLGPRAAPFCNGSDIDVDYLMALAGQLRLRPGDPIGGGIHADDPRVAVLIHPKR